MLKDFFTLIAKTFIVTFTAIASLGISFVVMIILLVAVVAVASETKEEAGPSLDNYETVYGEEDEGAEFVSIPINGMILGHTSETESMFASVLSGATFGYDVKEELAELAEEDDVAGVILEINSPGGTIYGTQAIVDGVKAFKEKTNKPVYVFISSMAASGGYWAAVSGDKVIADFGTSIGSIGVIAGPFKYYDGVVSEDGGAFVGGVVTENGIETEYITAGKYKDVGNPYRPITDEEREILQESVDGIYDDFVSYVADRRQMEQGVLREETGAMIFDSKQAKELNYIDEIASQDTAYNQLAQAAGKEKFHIIQKNSTESFLSIFTQAIGKAPTPQASLCGVVQKQTALVYHGDVTAVCH